MDRRPLHTFTAQLGAQTWSLRWRLPTALELLTQGAAHLPIPPALAEWLDRRPQATIPVDPESEYGVLLQFRELARHGEANARSRVRAEAAAIVAAVCAFRVSTPTDPAPGWVPCRLVRRVEAHHIPETPTEADPACLFFGHVPPSVRRGLAVAIQAAAEDEVPPEMMAALLENPQLASRVARASRRFGCGSPSGALSWSVLDWCLYLIDGAVTRREIETVERALAQRQVPIFPTWPLSMIGDA